MIGILDKIKLMWRMPKKSTIFLKITYKETDNCLEFMWYEETRVVRIMFIRGNQVSSIYPIPTSELGRIRQTIKLLKEMEGQKNGRKKNV